MLHSSKLIVAAGWNELLASNDLTSVAAIYQSTAGEVITRSSTTEVRRLNLPGADGAEQVLFIKKYWVNHPRQLWSGCLRGTFLGRSKAGREFDNLGRLRRWGLHAPEPVACGEERSARWLMRSCLISAGVPNPVPLDIFIRDRLPRAEAADATKRRALIDALAAATRQLHEHRFVHHDYFWRNIILSGEGLDQFWLIDAHKGRRWRWRWLDENNRAVDLAALDAAAVAYFRRAERLRFFLRYLNRSHLDFGSKRLLKRTLRLAAPMRDRQLQRVRGTRRS